MATILSDSELMTNYIPALPCPPSSHFVACLDPESRRPLVFSKSNDDVARLMVIKEDPDGHPRLVNFGKLLGISEQTPVVAFDCQQADDLTIFLCVAIAGENRTSTILVVRPFQFTHDILSGPSDQLDDSNQLTVLPPHAVGSVHTIRVGAPDAGHAKYPIILVTHQPLNRITAGSDITRIMVDPYIQAWTALRDMSLPVNVSHIINIAPAANAYGRGLYVLCDVGPTRQLIGEFARYDTDQNDGSLFWYDTTLICPPGASSIATVTDVKGRSSLFVSATSGLYRFTCSQATNNSAQPTLVQSDPLFQQSRELRVAQDGPLTTLWTLSKNGELGYLRSTDPTLASGLPPIPVLPQSQVFTAFSVTISSGNGDGTVCQTLIANDASGNLSVLQQFLDSGLWRSKPFYYASTADNVAVQSYNISIQVVDAKGNSVPPGSTIHIVASSYVNAMINGKPVTVTPGGADWPLDGSGEIALLVATKNIAAQTFIFSAIKDKSGTSLGTATLTLDPSAKVLNAMSQNGNLSQTTKTQTGALLFTGPNQPLAQDLTDANTGFNNLTTARQVIQTSNSNNPPVKPNAIMEEWHYIKQKVADIADWACKLVDNVWTFTCTVAGAIKSFALDTFEKVGEAFTWVWEKIKLGIDKLIEFIGFLFSWDDILATKNTIMNLTDALLDFVEANTDKLEPNMNILFDSLNAKLRSNPAGQDQSQSDPQSSSSGSAMHSTGLKWITERLKNGGCIEGAELPEDNSDGGDAEITAILEGEVTRAGAMVSNIVGQLGSAIEQLFSTTGSASVSQILSKLGAGMLTQLIQGARTAIGGILRVVGKLVKWFRDALDASVEVPVISPLYRKISGGDSLSLRGVFSLILAIPTTLIVKLITGSAPPTLDKMGPDGATVFEFLFRYNLDMFQGASPNKSDEQAAASAAALANQQQKQQQQNLNAGGGQVQAQAKAAAAAPASGSQGSGSDPSQDPNQQDLSPVFTSWLGGNNNDAMKAAILTKYTALGIGSGAGPDFEEWYAKLQTAVKIISTISAGTSAGIAVIKPVIKMIRMTIATFGIMSTLTGARVSSVAAIGSAPGKVMRLLTCFLGFFSSTTQTMIPIIKHDVAIVARWIMSGAAAAKSLIGIIFAFRWQEKTEGFYQALSMCVNTVKFGCSVSLYNNEIQAGDGPQNNMTCTGLALTGICMVFISDVSEGITYVLLRDGQEEAAVATMAIAVAASFTSGILRIARFGVQVNNKFLPTLMDV